MEPGALMTDDRQLPAVSAGAAMAAPPGLTAGTDPGAVTTVAAGMEALVAERWRHYYPARASGPAPTIRLTPRHFGFSLILQVDLSFPDGAERFMIKIRRQQKHGSFVREALTDRTLELSRLEYEEHRKAYAFFAERGDGLSVVRPLDFIPSHNAFVVEHARGDDLSKLAKAASPLTRPALRRCGAWWRSFHYELHGARERPWAADALEAGLARRLDRLKKIGAPLEILDALGRDIRELGRTVTPASVPVSVVHGDCKLRHVWATSEAIQVLDFGNTKTGDSWIDPAALVVELSLYSLWSNRLDSSARIPDIRTLVHAYFGGPPPLAFSLYVVDCLLKKWHRRLRNWGAGAGLRRLRRALQAAGLDTSLERLYIDRWFTTQIRAWLDVGAGRPPGWLQPLLTRDADAR